MDRRAAGALLALAACIVTSTAAPTADNTALDTYDEHSEGCYYNFQHYGEGDRIMTNEPCLNCTCHNRMLMCYLRVCPFTKAIGQDCTVEKRADQCCPIVTCPDVPVDLLTSTTSSPAEYGGTGVGKVDNYGCTINGKYFPEGSKVPPTPNKPCEHCYCIRNMTTCVMQECTLHVDGCTPIYHKDVCCPVRYFCDHPEDEMLLLDDKTTTVRPTEGFLLTTTTTEAPTTAPARRDCIENDQLYPDGALIKTEKPCEHCYCMKGDIVCVVQECGTPMENEGKNCTSMPPREGQCCPDTYICEGDEVTSEPSTKPTLEELTTIPSRRDFEGSGYRNEDDVPYTEVPTFATDIEGSGEEEMEQKPIDDSLRPEGFDDRITPAPEDEFILKTTQAPVSEDVEKTTAEPDKGLNTVPSEYELETTTKLPQIETKATEPTSVKEQDLTTHFEDETSKPSLPEATEPTTKIKTTQSTLVEEQTTVLQESSQPSGIETTPTTEERITESSIIEEHDTQAPFKPEEATEPAIMREPSQTEKLPTSELPYISQETIPSVDVEHHTEPSVATTTPSDEITMGPTKDEKAEEQTSEPDIMKLTTTIKSIEKESTVATPSIKLDITEPAPIHDQNTVPVDTEDEKSSEPSVIFKTTVSDNLYSTESPIELIPSTSPEEVSSEPALSEKTTPQIDIVTETAHSDDEQLHTTESTMINPEDEQVATTEPVFRRDDGTASPIESITQKESEMPTTLTVDKETIATPSLEASTEAGIETRQTTQRSEESDVDTTVQHKEVTTEAIMELSTFAHIDDKENIATQAPSVETISTTAVPETTSINPEDNEIAEAPSPGRIPGEGDCLIEGVTYKNESVVPSTNKCHSSCKCVSSIIKCDPIICSPPPEYMDNCQSTYDTPEACCPTYICDDGKETIPPQSHSQMSGTDSPLPTPSIDCSGDQCEILGEKQQPTEIPERTGSTDCKDKDCITGIDIPVPEFTEGCSDEKCELPLPPSKEQEKPITETPETCEGDSCEIRPVVTPTAKEPVCDTEKGCEPTPAPPCEGDSCKIKPISEEPMCDPEKGCKATSSKPCDSDNCKILPEIIPPHDATESCKNEEECKQVKVPEVSAPSCEGDTCTTSDGVLCKGDDCIQKQDIPTDRPTEESQSCLEETGCKKPQDAPAACEGDDCGEKAPIPAQCTDAECLPQEPVLPTQETTQTELVGTEPSISETEGPLKAKDQTELPEHATTLVADIATEKSPEEEKVTSEPESIKQHVTMPSKQPELEQTTTVQIAAEENLTEAPEVGYTAPSISSETTIVAKLDAQETTKAPTDESSVAFTSPEPSITNVPPEITTEGHDHITESQEPQVTETLPQKDKESTKEDTERPLFEVTEPQVTGTSQQVEEKQTTTSLPELLTESDKIPDKHTEAPEQVTERPKKEEEQVDLPTSETETTQHEPAVITTEPSVDKKEPSMYDADQDKTKKPEITEEQETTTMSMIQREGETVTASQAVYTQPEETEPKLPAAETGQPESLPTESSTVSFTENSDDTPHITVDVERTESPEKHSSTDKPLVPEYGTTESLPVPTERVEDEVERTTQGLKSEAPPKLDATSKPETSDIDEEEIQSEPPLSLVTASEPHTYVSTTEADDKIPTTVPEMLTEKPTPHDIEQEPSEKEKPVNVSEVTTLVPTQETKAPEVESVTPSQEPVDQKPIPEIEASISVVDHDIEQMSSTSSEKGQKLTESPEIYERATTLPSTPYLPGEEVEKVTEKHEAPVPEDHITTEEHRQPETESTTEHVHLATYIPEQHIQEETEEPTSVSGEPEEDKVTQPESQAEITTEFPELHIRAETEQPTEAPMQLDTDKDIKPEEQGEIVTEIPESHVQAETEKSTEAPVQQDEDKFTQPEKQDDMVTEVTESYVKVETEKSTEQPAEENMVTEPERHGEVATVTPESHVQPKTEKPTDASGQTEEDKVTQPQEPIETSTHLPESHIKEETEKPALVPSQPEVDVTEEKYTTKPELTQTDIPLILETESPVIVTESQPHEIDEKHTTQTPETANEVERETQSSAHEEEITTKLPDQFDVDHKFSTEPPLIEDYQTRAPEDEIYTTKTPEVATEKIHTEIPVAQETLVTKEPDFVTTEHQKPASEHETKPDQQHTDVPVSVVTEPQEPLTEKYGGILTEEPPVHDKDRQPTVSIPVDILTATESPQEETPESSQTSKPEDKTSETTPYLVELEEHTHKPYEEPSTDIPAVEPTISHEKPDQESPITQTEKLPEDEAQTELPQTETDKPSDQKEEAPEQPISTIASEAPEQSTETVKIIETTPETASPDLLDKFGKPEKEEILPSTSKQALDEESTTPVPSLETEEPIKYPEPETYPQPEKDVTLKPYDVPVDTTAPEEEFIPVTTKVTTAKAEEEATTHSTPQFDKFTTPEKPSESFPPTSAPETPKPDELQPTDEVPSPEDDGQFPPSGGYNQEPDYVEEDQAFGPGTCRYGGKVYVSAQQIPRDDPCDFCFCFRSDIICLQQSCPPPIHGCHEEPIQGFCCPRYECPVSMATTLNVTTTTTTTTTTLPPHFLPHAYKGAAQRRGCQIKGHTYKVGEVVRASSGPCLHCTCGGDGQMKCDPKACTPEPMLRQMIAAAVSAKRRR